MDGVGAEVAEAEAVDEEDSSSSRRAEAPQAMEQEPPAGGGGAQTAAGSAPVQDGEALLYEDGAQQKTFHSRARFHGAQAAASREAGLGDSDQNQTDFPLWSSGINTYPLSSTFQFVSVAHAAAKQTGGDRAFNTASTKKTGAADADWGMQEEEGQISLRFAVVPVTSKEIKTYTLVNTLLDDGATLTFLLQRAVKVLGLEGRVEKLEVIGYGGNVTVCVCDAVYCGTIIESRNLHYSKPAMVAVLPDPAGSLHATN